MKRNAASAAVSAGRRGEGRRVLPTEQSQTPGPRGKAGGIAGSGNQATVQLAISDVPYASALRHLLEDGGSRDVRLVAAPDTKQEGVIVIDSDALDLLPSPLPNPERAVLITRNDPHHLAQAWDAGIRSVVFNEDPLSTAVLAIMAAGLRASKDSRCGQTHRNSGQAVPAGSDPARCTPDSGSQGERG